MFLLEPGLILAGQTGDFVMTATAPQPPTPPTPSAGVPTAPVILPLTESTYTGNVGRTFRDSDAPQFPQPASAPDGAPNIVLIMLDDCGFGQFSLFGGGTPAPAMEKLAAEGLRFNRFHTTALCSPTRAALLTGRNHHSAGFGVISEITSGYDGYTGIIPKSTACVAETLRQNGYATAWIGKNHNTPTWEQNPAGPFDHWPTSLGFEHFYGFLGGNASHWEPVLYENTTPVPRSDDPHYHLSVDLADHAINWVRSVKAINPKKPFFLHLVPGATHSPHHAPPEWSAKFKGQFDDGWDAYRERTLARQKELGVVPADTLLTPRPEGIPAWDTLEPDQRALYARMMEVFAGFGAHIDHEMGRVIEAVKEFDDADNTLIIYILGDNGASAEGGLQGTLNEIASYSSVTMAWQDMLPHIDEIGTRHFDNHFPVGWAHAMDTPFQWTKQVASHFGGTRNPTIVSWPRAIQDQGGLRSQFHHVIDIAPTLLEAAGIPAPSIVNGTPQKPIEGVSMLYAFNDADAAGRRTTQYFEMQGYRGIYHDGWMASSMTFEPWNLTRPEFDIDTAPWELYDIEKDFSQATDLAVAEPAKLRQMEDVFWTQAAKYNVLPIDWRSLERVSDIAMGRPNPTLGRTVFEYPGKLTCLSLGSSPVLGNRSFSVTAEVELPDEEGNGMIFTQGGFTAGWAFYLLKGKLVGVHNFLGLQRFRTESANAVPKGASSLKLDFRYEGTGHGAGGMLSLYADGLQVAQGRIERTVPGAYSAFEGQDIGMDYGSPVDDSYTPPFHFNGVIRRVIVELQ
jgi:arylsulfatase